MNTDNAQMANATMFSVWIGGQLFSIERRLLATHPNSRLAQLASNNATSGSGDDVVDGFNHVTANPQHVFAILGAYREGYVRFDRGVSALVAMETLEFWGLEASLVLEPHVRMR